MLVGWRDTAVHVLWYVIYGFITYIIFLTSRLLIHFTFCNMQIKTCIFLCFLSFVSAQERKVSLFNIPTFNKCAKKRNPLLCPIHFVISPVTICFEKLYLSTLKVICIVLIASHWFIVNDMINMMFIIIKLYFYILIRH